MARMPSLFVSHGAPSFALEPGLVGPRHPMQSDLVLQQPKAGSIA
jgi:aromatic ring-opening dioxygenase catalytic subunit (LigB family)